MRPLLPIRRAKVFCEGLDHPECLAVHPDGSIWAGGEAGQIYRVSADGKRIDEVANTGGFILGVAISPDGSWLAACDLKKHQVWRVDLKTGQLKAFATGADGHRFKIPNSVVFDDRGQLYVSESGDFGVASGKVLRFTEAERGEIWCKGPIKFANGMALAADGKSMYVVATLLPGLEEIPILADGSAGRRRVVARLPKTVPDGVAVDSQGAIYVTCYAPSRIYRIDPSGALRILLDDWFSHTLSNPTNVAFGGPKFNELFAANLGRWHLTRIDLRRRGSPLACHKS